MENNIKKDIIDYYLNNNKSIIKTKLNFKISRAKIIKILETNNIIIKRPQKRKYYNINYFEKIDTNDKAYFLGLLYADGCNHIKENRVELGLIEEDDYIIKYLSNIFFNEDASIYIKSKDPKRANERPMKRLYLTNKKISNDLFNLGLLNNKTKILTFPNIDNEYKFAFIRGYFDGDGTVSSKNISRHAKISFTSCSKKLLIEIQKYLKNYKINAFIVKYKDKNAYDLNLYNHKEINEFYNLIYKDSNIHMLRKFEKIKIISEYYNNKHELIQ